MDANSGGLAAWAEISGELEWATPWTSLYEPSDRLGTWFAGGRINNCVNCVDRHVRKGRGETPAILWEGEPGDRRVLTYAKLREEIGLLAGTLRELGVGAGDHVALHLGALPEMVVALLACARIGAVHTVLAVNHPVDDLVDILGRVPPKVLFTQDGAWHGGTVIPVKARADAAIAAAGHIPHTIVIQRTGTNVGWRDRDRWLHDLLSIARSNSTDSKDTGPLPAALDAGHVAWISLSTDREGRTTLVRHGTAGLIASAVAIHRHGVSAGGVVWYATDLPQVVTIAHGVYGPLACGDTTVMYEGMLEVPTRGRAWELIERYGIRTLVGDTSTILRLRGPSRRPSSPRATPLQRVVVVGTPAADELAWLTHTAGGRHISVSPAWARNDAGGIVAVRDPVEPEKLPDAGVDVVDQESDEFTIRRPWPGMAYVIDPGRDA